LSLAREAIQAIMNVSGTSYQAGTASDLSYPVGGASDDYAKSIGVKYTVTVEMRDNGQNAFLISPSEIVPNAEG